METLPKKYFVIAPLFLIVGHYLAYRAYTCTASSGISVLWGIPGFLLIVSSLLMMTLLTIPLYNRICKKIPADRQVIKRLFNMTYNIAGICLIVLLAAPFVYLSKKYKADQLKNYGVIQKVVIEKITSGGRSGRHVFFNMDINGLQVNEELPDKHFAAGDTATIIFSAQNPSMVSWLEDYSR